jgi:SagB-type dehydrogenase family enzyme
MAGSLKSAIARATLLIVTGGLCAGQPSGTERTELPPASTRGESSLETALDRRESVRSFAEEPLPLKQVAQLLWAAQGVTHAERYRTAPSAGALYPLEVYLVAGEVEGLPAGTYRYVPASHDLVHVAKGDRRAALAEAALGQTWVGEAPAVLVIAAVFERTRSKYGERAARYVPIEAGAAGQNVLLQATDLGLGSVMVGAFRDEKVSGVVGLREREKPLLLIPVGTPR